jgi:hypothetical protein
LSTKALAIGDQRVDQIQDQLGEQCRRVEEIFGFGFFFSYFALNRFDYLQ